MAVTVVAVIVLIIILIFAGKSIAKRLSGQSSCCGTGGDSVAEPPKKLEGEVIGTKILHVEGMSCANCKNRVEHVSNTVKGAACQVDLKAKTATISYDQEIDVEHIKDMIEKLGYTVTSIEG